MLRLKEWRERRGMTGRKLAELAGVHFVNISRLEAGKGDPQLSTLLKLCRALRITIGQLVKQSKQKGGKQRWVSR
jgi:transcriptional regulator with XRE-family HTH domain